MITSKVSINNKQLLTRSWTIDDPNAVVLIVHGYGEHCGRYQEIADVLNAEGYSVYSYDRRGEGASEGKKGHIASIDNHVADLDAFIKQLPSSDKPFLILAHSLGGLVTVKYLIDHSPNNLAGVMLSSPLLKADPDMAPLLQKIAPFVAAIAPWAPSVRLDTNLISRDSAEVAKYENDPLIFHGTTNAKTGYEILKAINYIQERFAKITVPFLVMHGTADKLANPAGSQQIYDEASSEDKEIKHFEGLYHETMREPEKHLFFDSVLAFIRRITNQ